MTDLVLKDKARADFTEGSVIGAIVRMGLPSMIGFMSGHLYTLADMYWLAGLPERETAVAAVTIFSNIFWFFFSFNQLIGSGSVAIISRRYGEKDFGRAETAIKETFLLKWTFGLAFGILGYLFVEDILYLAGARGEAITMGAEYGRVMFLGMGFSYCAFSVYTAMRGVANPNMAMGIMLGSTVLNVILDPILIFGYLGFPAMGVVGAAVASVFSYALAFIIGLALFYNGTTNVKLRLKGQVPVSFGSAYRLLKIGIPAWISSMSFSGGRLLVMPMIAMFGNAVVAAYGVGTQITSLGIQILVGIGLGLASLIGHNLGSLKKERAQKTGDQALLLAVGLMIVCGLIIFFGAGIIMRLYFESYETVHYGIVLLRVLAISLPFVGVYVMLEQIYTGVGLNTPAMVVSMGHSWLLEIPAIFVLTQVLNFDQNAVWWSITAATVVSSTAFYWYYRRGQWLEVKV